MLQNVVAFVTSLLLNVTEFCNVLRLTDEGLHFLELLSLKNHVNLIILSLTLFCVQSGL